MRVLSVPLLAATLLCGCSIHSGTKSPAIAAIPIVSPVIGRIDVAHGTVHFRPINPREGVDRSDVWLRSETLWVENRPRIGATWRREVVLDAEGRASAAAAFRILKDRYGDASSIEIDVLEDGSEIATLGSGASRIEVVSLDSPLRSS